MLIIRTINVEDKDWKLLKILAIERNTSITEIIRNLINTELIEASKKEEGEFI